MSSLADPGSIAFLADEGFEGLRTVGQLHADGCEEVPNARGLYAIVRESIEPPRFAATSSAPCFRHTEPTLPIEALEQRWVPGAQLLFLGMAPGPGVRSLLKQRVKRYLRFGHGRHVAHWAGRAIWQLGDRSALRVAWKAMAEGDPAPMLREYLDRFERQHGRPPFANSTEAPDGGDGDDEPTAPAAPEP